MCWVQIVTLNELFDEHKLLCFFFGDILRAVGMNFVFCDNSEHFVNARAIEVVNINVSFKYEIWELDTTDAIQLINLVDVVVCFENLFIFFINANNVIDFDLTPEVFILFYL